MDSKPIKLDNLINVFGVTNISLNGIDRTIVLSIPFNEIFFKCCKRIKILQEPITDPVFKNK